MACLRSLKFSVATFFAFATGIAAETVELFLDIDYSLNPSAANSIELGVRAALSEIDYEIDGTRIEIVQKDNRGNVKRSKRNMDAYLKSERALAIIGGLHSPPYLTHRQFINENGILTLLPWSAAGPITRSESAENWIFRLSVDDTKSGEFLVKEAFARESCSSTALILLDTGWGRANHKTLTSALASRGMTPSSVDFFPNSVATQSARSIAQRIHSDGTDCAFLLSDWTNGAIIVKALAELAPGIRLFSHWGIMGGEFALQVTHQEREAVNLMVLQTCALRREAEDPYMIKHALSLSTHSGDTVSSLSAPTGFVHGFDLTRVLTAAIRQAKSEGFWSDSIVENRAYVRGAMIALSNPVSGILATYAPPFQPYSAKNRDGHEALGVDDLCLARFTPGGVLEDAG